jgi:hypothetical protein
MPEIGTWFFSLGVVFIVASAIGAQVEIAGY